MGDDGEHEAFAGEEVDEAVVDAHESCVEHSGGTLVFVADCKNSAGEDESDDS